MANSTVIKDFLVQVGFKTDEASLKKFSDGIDRATKSVFLLATAVTATATTVAIGVERFAANLEKLYFAAYRTGTSAVHIKAFERAIQDMGGTAEAAMASIEGLTAFLRNNPAGGSAMINQWLSHVGKQLTGDKGTDLAAIGELFAKNTAEGNARLNDQLASTWGISSDIALQTQMPGFAEDQERIRKRLQSAGFDDATVKAHEFMNQVRELGDWFTILGTKVSEALDTKLGWSLKNLNTYMAAHGDELVGKIVDGVQKFVAVAGPFFDAVMKMIDFLVELNTATDGFSTKLLAFIALMQFTGGFKIVGALWDVIKAFRALGPAIVAASEAAELGGTAATAASAARGGAKVAAAGKTAQQVAAEAAAVRALARAKELEAAGDVAGAAAARATAAAATRAAEGTVAKGLMTRFALLRGLGVGLSYLTGAGELATAGYLGYEGADALTQAFPNNPLAKLGVALSHGVSNTEGVLSGVRHPSQAPLKALIGMGWSPEQAAGIVANLQSESGEGLDPNSVGDKGAAYGIGQWHKDRQEAFARHFGHDIHGSSRDEQLAFVNWELRHGEDVQAREAGRHILASHDARESGEYFSRLYERPAAADQAARQRGALAERIAGGINVKTDIHIGHADNETVKQIKRIQDQTFADAFRSAQQTHF